MSGEEYIKKLYQGGMDVPEIAEMLSDNNPVFAKMEDAMRTVTKIVSGVQRPNLSPQTIKNVQLGALSEHTNQFLSKIPRDQREAASLYGYAQRAKVVRANVRDVQEMLKIKNKASLESVYPKWGAWVDASNRVGYKGSPVPPSGLRYHTAQQLRLNRLNNPTPTYAMGGSISYLKNLFTRKPNIYNDILDKSLYPRGHYNLKDSNISLTASAAASLTRQNLSRRLSKPTFKQLISQNKNNLIDAAMASGIIGAGAYVAPYLGNIAGSMIGGGFGFARGGNVPHFAFGSPGGINWFNPQLKQGALRSIQKIELMRGVKRSINKINELRSSVANRQHNSDESLISLELSNSINELKTNNRPEWIQNVGKMLNLPSGFSLGDLTMIRNENKNNVFKDIADPSVYSRGMFNLRDANIGFSIDSIVAKTVSDITKRNDAIDKSQSTLYVPPLQNVKRNAFNDRPYTSLNFSKSEIKELNEKLKNSFPKVLKKFTSSEPLNVSLHNWDSNDNSMRPNVLGQYIPKGAASHKDLHDSVRFANKTSIDKALVHEVLHARVQSNLAKHMLTKGVKVEDYINKIGGKQSLSNYGAQTFSKYKGSIYDYPTNIATYTTSNFPLAKAFQENMATLFQTYDPDINKWIKQSTYGNLGFRDEMDSFSNIMAFKDMFELDINTSAYNKKGEWAFSKFANFIPHRAKGGSLGLSGSMNMQDYIDQANQLQNLKQFKNNPQALQDYIYEQQLYNLISQKTVSDFSRKANYSIDPLSQLTTTARSLKSTGQSIYPNLNFLPSRTITPPRDSRNLFGIRYGHFSASLRDNGNLRFTLPKHFKSPFVNGNLRIPRYFQFSTQTGLFGRFAGRRFAGGGLIRGPGTGTSDSISTTLPPGYVIPKSTVNAMGAGFFGGGDTYQSNGTGIPAQVSNGEYFLPQSSVKAAGGTGFFDRMLSYTRDSVLSPSESSRLFKRRFASGGATYAKGGDTTPMMEYGTKLTVQGRVNDEVMAAKLADLLSKKFGRPVEDIRKYLDVTSKTLTRYVSDTYKGGKGTTAYKDPKLVADTISVVDCTFKLDGNTATKLGDKTGKIIGDSVQKASGKTKAKVLDRKEEEALIQVRTGKQMAQRPAWATDLYKKMGMSSDATLDEFRKTVEGQQRRGTKRQQEDVINKLTTEGYTFGKGLPNHLPYADELQDLSDLEKELAKPSEVKKNLAGTASQLVHGFRRQQPLAERYAEPQFMSSLRSIPLKISNWFSTAPTPWDLKAQRKAGKVAHAAGGHGGGGTPAIDDTEGERLIPRHRGDKAKSRWGTIGWTAASLSMSSMGVYFSILGLVTSIQSAVTMLTTAVMDLNKAFQASGYLRAFGKSIGLTNDQIKSVTGSSKDLVETWKKVTALQSFMQTMFANLATKLFNNPELIEAITEAFTNLFDKLSQKDVIDSFAKLLTNLVDIIPNLIPAFKMFADLLERISENKGLVQFASFAFVLSMLLQPVTSLISAFGAMMSVLTSLSGFLMTTSVNATLTGRSFFAVALGADAATVGLSGMNRALFVTGMALRGIVAMVAPLLALEVAIEAFSALNPWGIKSPWGTPILSTVGGALGFSSGGEVNGPGDEDDDKITAQLSDGEYVINAKSARKLGRRTLDKLNKLATGGSTNPTSIPTMGIVPNLAAESKAQDAREYNRRILGINTDIDNSTTETNDMIKGAYGSRAHHVIVDNADQFGGGGGSTGLNLQFGGFDLSDILPHFPDLKVEDVKIPDVKVEDPKPIKVEDPKFDFKWPEVKWPEFKWPWEDKSIKVDKIPDIKIEDPKPIEVKTPPDIKIDDEKLISALDKFMDDIGKWKWPEIKWPEVKWPEFKWPEIKFNWPKLPEFKWPWDKTTEVPKTPTFKEYGEQKAAEINKRIAEEEARRKAEEQKTAQEKTAQEKTQWKPEKTSIFDRLFKGAPEYQTTLDGRNSQSSVSTKMVDFLSGKPKPGYTWSVGDAWWMDRFDVPQIGGDVMRTAKEGGDVNEALKASYLNEAVNNLLIQGGARLLEGYGKSLGYGTEGAKVPIRGRVAGGSAKYFAKVGEPLTYLSAAALPIETMLAGQQLPNIVKSGGFGKNKNNVEQTFLTSILGMVTGGIPSVLSDIGMEKMSTDMFGSKSGKELLAWKEQTSAKLKQQYGKNTDLIWDLGFGMNTLGAGVLGLPEAMTKNYRQEQLYNAGMGMGVGAMNMVSPMNLVNPMDALWGNPMEEATKQLIPSFDSLTEASKKAAIQMENGDPLGALVTTVNADFTTPLTNAATTYIDGIVSPMSNLINGITGLGTASASVDDSMNQLNETYTTSSSTVQKSLSGLSLNIDGSSNLIGASLSSTGELIDSTGQALGLKLSDTGELIKTNGEKTGISLNNLNQLVTDKGQNLGVALDGTNTVVMTGSDKLGISLTNTSSTITNSGKGVGDSLTTTSTGVTTSGTSLTTSLDTTSTNVGTSGGNLNTNLQTTASGISTNGSSLISALSIISKSILGLDIPSILSSILGGGTTTTSTIELPNVDTSNLFQTPTFNEQTQSVINAITGDGNSTISNVIAGLNSVVSEISNSISSSYGNIIGGGGYTDANGNVVSSAYTVDENGNIQYVNNDVSSTYDAIEAKKAAEQDELNKQFVGTERTTQSMSYWQGALSPILTYLESYSLGGTRSFQEALTAAFSTVESISSQDTMADFAKYLTGTGGKTYEQWVQSADLGGNQSVLNSLLSQYPNAILPTATQEYSQSTTEGVATVDQYPLPNMTEWGAVGSESWLQHIKDTTASGPLKLTDIDTTGWTSPFNWGLMQNEPEDFATPIIGGISTTLPYLESISRDIAYNPIYSENGVQLLEDTTNLLDNLQQVTSAGNNDISSALENISSNTSSIQSSMEKTYIEPVQNIYLNITVEGSMTDEVSDRMVSTIARQLGISTVKW
jgi:hypothetical protein